jgi:hypothetical protein
MQPVDERDQLFMLVINGINADAVVILPLQ